jgi:hypothetical protein
MKRYNQYIKESLRDKMTPKSKQDIIDNLGSEENYNNYIKLLNSKASIDSVLSTDDIVIDKKRNIIYFEMRFGLKIFTVSIEDGKWKLELQIGYDDVNEYYDTWEKVIERIKNNIKDSLNKDIDEKQIEIDKLQSYNDRMKKIISELDEKL